MTLPIVSIGLEISVGVQIFFAMMFNLPLPIERIAFGGAVNVGFIESGYIEREEDESLDVGLQEMLADLECYYNDGPSSVSRIICNERM